LRANQPIEQRILQIAAPVAADLGLEIVRVRITGSNAKTLQIMAERGDGTMTVEDCTDLSNALSAVFDVEDPFPEEWTLEVSSPGIDRPLTRLEHFARGEGFEAKIELDRLVEGQKRYRGVLAGVEDDNVLLDIAGEDETALIPFDWIDSAKLMMSDALIAESLRRSKAGGDKGEQDA